MRDRSSRSRSIAFDRPSSFAIDSARALRYSWRCRADLYSKFSFRSPSARASSMARRFFGISCSSRFLSSSRLAADRLLEGVERLLDHAQNGEAHHHRVLERALAIGREPGRLAQRRQRVGRFGLGEVGQQPRHGPAGFRQRHQPAPVRLQLVAHQRLQDALPQAQRRRGSQRLVVGRALRDPGEERGRVGRLHQARDRRGARPGRRRARPAPRTGSRAATGRSRPSPPRRTPAASPGGVSRAIS